MLDLASLSPQNATTYLKKSAKSNGHFSDFILENLLVTFNVVGHSFLVKTLSTTKLNLGIPIVAQWKRI